MSTQATDVVSPVPTRRASDAMTPDYSGSFALGTFYESMTTSRRDRPQAVDLFVHRQLLDESAPPEEDVTIHLVVTSVRQIMIEPPDDDPYRYPEFEVEGWLLAPHGVPLDQTVWVRCALRSNDTEEITECTVYLLEPGEELGTARTPGVF